LPLSGKIYFITAESAGKKGTVKKSTLFLRVSSRVFAAKKRIGKKGQSKNFRNFNYQLVGITGHSGKQVPITVHFPGQV